MRKSVLFTLIASGLIIFLGSFGGGKGKYPSGAPAGYTGSPFDGKDCSDAACHGGTSTAVTGWITSNVPAQGYTPGSSYTITVTVTGNSGDNKGFEISPQALDGSLVGTLTPGTGTKFAGSNPKYVTHSSAVSSATATWNITWVAPAVGVGAVTFYGAFVASFPNVYHSTLVIPENNVGIAELKEAVRILVYPNPAAGRMNVSYTLLHPEHVTLCLYDLTGNKVLTLMEEDQAAGKITQTFDLKGEVRQGIYFVKFSSNSGSAFQKVIIN
jgi:hypothetical protein